MDRDLYTAAGHAALDFANPLSPGTIDRALSLLTLPDGARFLDIGCGKGELSVRLARRWRARVDAVDRSVMMIEELKRRSAGLNINVVVGDADTFTASAIPGTYDGVACIGSSHALGGWSAALGRIAALLRPGGEALVGEGVWEREPNAESLHASGMTREEMPALGDWAASAQRAGLDPRWVVTSTPREWDEYEWAHARGIEAFAAANPGHPETPAMLARSRAWRRAYAEWNRGVLGFGLMIARRASVVG